MTTEKVHPVTTQTEPEVSKSNGLFANWKWDGLIVIMVSSFCYLCDYTYEVGYARHFSIPLMYIVIDIRSILCFSIFLFFLLMFVLTVLSYPISYIFSPSTNIHPSIRKFLITISFFTTIGLVGGYTFSNSSFWGFFLIYISWFLADLYLVVRSTRRYKSDFTSEANVQFEKKSFSLLIFPEKLFGITDSKVYQFLVKYIYSSAMILWFCYVAGTGVASRWDIFLVTNSSKPQIVLTRYGDKYLLAEYDPSKKIIEPTFSLKDVTDSSLSLTLRRIGPFPQVEPLSTPNP